MSYAISKRYALAVLDILERDGQLDHVEAVVSGIQSFAQACSVQPVLMEVLSSPNVMPDEKTRVVESIGKKLSLPQLVNKLVLLLARRNRLVLLGGIADVLTELTQYRQGIMSVQVQTAEELDDQQREKITQELQKRLGSEIRLHEEIQPDLLAGVVVKVNDVVLDGSLKNQLTRLKKRLAAVGAR